MSRSKQQPSEEPQQTIEERRREDVVMFLAELMQVTGPPDQADAFRAALQAYCDSLRPWLEPGDCPPHPRDTFPLLEDCVFDSSGENVSVVLSPEAEAFFCAWLRRNKILHEGGFNTAHAWSN